MKKKIRILAAVIAVVAIVLCIVHFAGKPDTEPETKEFTPGLYETGALELYAAGKMDALEDKLIMSWSKLLDSTRICVRNGYVYTFAVDGAKLTQSKAEELVNPSSKKLKGDLILPNNGTIKGFGFSDQEKEVLGISFTKCLELTGISIPASVTSLVNYEFYGCTSLKTVYFEEGSQLDYFSYRMFSECESLVSLRVPDSVTHFRPLAMSGCTGLKEITFGTGSNLRTLQENAFKGCTALESISLPSALKWSDDGIFRDCSSLKNIVFNSPFYADYVVLGKGLADEVTITYQSEAPYFGTNHYSEMNVIIHYPAGDSTWGEFVGNSYGGTVVWVADQ